MLQKDTKKIRKRYEMLRPKTYINTYLSKSIED